MSEFDRQDQECFTMVHGNPRRRGVIRTVGYIVPEQEARQLAYTQARSQRSSGWAGLVMMAVVTLAVIAVTVAAMVG